MTFMKFHCHFQNILCFPSVIFLEKEVHLLWLESSRVSRQTPPMELPFASKLIYYLCSLFVLKNMFVFTQLFGKTFPQRLTEIILIVLRSYILHKHIFNEKLILQSFFSRWIEMTSGCDSLELNMVGAVDIQQSCNSEQVSHQQIHKKKAFTFPKRLYCL